MARGYRKNKNPFADLDEDTKNAIASMKDDEVHKRISKAALDQEALDQAMKDDGDLEEKKSALKYAREPYVEGRKRLKLLVRFAKTILEARGREAGTSPTEGVR